MKNIFYNSNPMKKYITTDGKTCTICGDFKLIDELTKDRLFPLGVRAQCKACRNKLAEARRKNPDNKERYRGYKIKSLENIDKQREYRKVNRSRYPEKIAAMYAISHFEKHKGFVLHHWSYNNEHYKDVIKIPLSAHSLVHKNMVYDPSFYYRRKDTLELLDTKEKHLNFINELMTNEKI